MNLPLFSEFSSADKAAWKQQAVKDLKGKDFNANLQWISAEGLVVEPYYAAEDLNDDRLSEVQSVQQKPMGWLNQPVIIYENEKETNAKMKAVLQKGADALVLDLGSEEVGEIEFSKLFNGLKLSDFPVYFQTNGQETSVMTALLKFIPFQMKGGFADDGLARWMVLGRLPETHFEELAALVKKTQSSPQFRIVCVSSHPFHNAGANAVQELAFTLASAVTYMDKLTDLGLTAEEVSAKLYFSVSTGTNYFMEIAKLRALRYLWEKVSLQFRAGGVPPEVLELEQQTLNPKLQTVNTFIHAQTSTFYSSAITPDSNMLRATTEAMSAVMGGCNALTVHAYDESLKTQDDFSERIARNISTLLKEEAHLDKAVDPAAGSYYLEHLTLQLIDAAWDLFLKVEEKGGLMAAFEENFIQNQVESNFEATLSALQTNKRVMIGVNKFRVEESMKHNFVNVLNVDKVEVEIFKLLKNKRISQTFEQ
ncbi:methylmalonyl-CoA mutase family protein [Runella sp.]|jgi:methylmalonyl-CoA mutase|uniref:methylmalonyl-CoA mutase family protein n=1 Tax=Runella sp. TaxID=1960881 RepID=UPI00262D17AD|nr:methylmalonyl-CoA mutase family protein [Runella sp.]